MLERTEGLRSEDESSKLSSPEFGWGAFVDIDARDAEGTVGDGGGMRPGMALAIVMAALWETSRPNGSTEGRRCIDLEDRWSILGKCLRIAPSRLAIVVSFVCVVWWRCVRSCLPYLYLNSTYGTGTISNVEVATEAPKNSSHSVLIPT